MNSAPGRDPALALVGEIVQLCTRWAVEQIVKRRAVGEVQADVASALCAATTSHLIDTRSMTNDDLALVAGVAEKVLMPAVHTVLDRNVAATDNSNADSNAPQRRSDKLLN